MTEQTPTPNPDFEGVNDELILQIQSVLNDWRSELLATVEARVLEVTKPDKPSPKGKDSVSTALKEELDALKQKLANEETNRVLSELASRSNAHPGLLSAVLKSKGTIKSTDDGFIIETKEGVRLLESYVSDYLATDEGAMLVSKPKSPTFPIGNVPKPHTTLDPYSILASSM